MRKLRFKLGGTRQISRSSGQLERETLGCNIRLQCLKSACISVYKLLCALLNLALTYMGTSENTVCLSIFAPQKQRAVTDDL